MTAPERIRLAVIGGGKMGRAVAALAPERGFDVVGTLGSDARLVGDPVRALRGAQVAVEFTEPGAAAENVLACAAAGCPVVVGTTGWSERFDEVARTIEERGGAMLSAANFSVGVHLFQELVRAAASAMRASDFDVHLVETHHAAKRDAPSGTARDLGEILERGLGRRVPTTSVRVGSVPGTHEVIFDSSFEQIRLTHSVRDRRVFADGALLAARWLLGKRGVFTMGDVLQANLASAKPSHD